MSATEPYAVTVKGAERYGYTRAAVYRNLSAGNFKALKDGRRTLILTESIREHMAKLPPATFRPPATQAT